MSRSLSFPRKRESRSPLKACGDDRGTVYLAGAGPGDAGLITLRAASLLEEADAVVYDWLVNPAILELALKAEKIYVGKKLAGLSSPRPPQRRRIRPSAEKRGSPLKACGDDISHQGYVTQEKTNSLLVKLARAGKKVVRLKGGDPFIFGRGGEEASALTRAGIRFEIVPGVSAGTAAPAYAGIPVTDRRYASHVTFVTGHEQEGGGGVSPPSGGIDWKQLAGLKGTLVSFMGVANLPHVVKSLTAGGMSPKTSVCVIEWGTLPRQRVIEGTLGTIVKKARAAGIESPAVTVIGEVNRLRKELAWFNRRPLAGKTVLVTRARSQASGLRQVLEEKGARVLEFPTIRILPAVDPRPLDEALAAMARFDWIVFTSANAVEHVFERMHEMGRDARIFSHTRIAVIGEATRAALLARGLRADLMPEEFTSEALVERLRQEKQVIGRRFLLPRSDLAPDFLRTKLQVLGAKVTDVVAYRTVPAREEAAKLKEWLRQEEIDFITFSSSSTVKNFFRALPQKERAGIKSKFVSIGPMTSETLASYGVKTYREASEHTIPGLVEALTQK